MSLLGAPLETSQIREIRCRFPGFKGPVPKELKYWSEEDVAAFFGSNGEVRPRQTAGSEAHTCPLLTKARLRLAEERIATATAEYRSLCRHLREAREVSVLAGAAACVEVQRVTCVAGPLSTPVIVDKQRDWKARMWNLDFWKRECGSFLWSYGTRTPSFEDDLPGADSFAMEASIANYVDYVRAVQRADRKCSEENALAYPRLSFEGFAPFCHCLRHLFEEAWADLGPPGLEDLTPQYMEAFAEHFSLDALEHLAAHYTVSAGPTGAVSRLHVEESGAHVWLNQIEGRRLFFLFSPQEEQNLYASTSTKESPVDIFFPSSKRHPKFAEATAHVAMLYLGQTLVVPAGWWWCSAALEPSVSLRHEFWDTQNRARFAEALRAHFNWEGLEPGQRSCIEAGIEEVGERVVCDDPAEE